MKKWLLGSLIALFMVSAAFAGEDPYVAIVGNDFLDANSFYFSPKVAQFLYDQDNAPFNVPFCLSPNDQVKGFEIPPFRGQPAGCEQFRSQSYVKEAEICDAGLEVDPDSRVASFTGLLNAKVTAGNSGWFEWYIRLPKKPSGEINLCFQCGVLKPNAFMFVGMLGGSPIELCAAETGERVAPGLCARQEVDPGTNPIIPKALPMVFAEALPGDTSVDGFDTGFKLTAWKNPSAYQAGGNEDGTNFPKTFTAATADLVLLDGSAAARVLLKSCFDKCVVVKLPVEGQINAAGQREHDLEAGDIIHVKLTIPRAGTTDVYCSSQSLKIMGIGESP